MNPSLEPITSAIYDAALDTAAWPAVMRGMRERFRTAAETFYILDFHTRAVREGCLSGIAPRWFDCFAEHYFSSDNPWHRLSPMLHRPGVIRTNERLEAFTGDAGILYRSRYYNEWMAPQGLRYSLGNTLTTDRSAIANITLLRSRDEPTFDAADLADFERLSAHFSRALQLHQRLEGLSLQRAQLAGMLDRLHEALVLVDAHGRLVHANRSAQHLLDQRDALALRMGRLACHHPADQQRLQALVDGLRRHGDDFDPPPAFPLRRRSDGLVLTVGATVLRLPMASSCTTQVFLLLSLTAPAHPPRLAADVLRERHGLTPAEVRLAQALVDGHPLREAAHRLSITYGTARERLKHIFQKTGTCRQAELVARLVSESAARPN